MATAHLIFGYLGTGKTTLARRLERELPAVRFSHDEWMVALFGRDPPQTDFEDQARRVSVIIESVWPQCLRLGLDVILDLGLWRRAERDRCRRLAMEAGGDWTLYRLDCNDAEALRRLASRNAGSERDLVITPATYSALKAQFEPLEPDEAWVKQPPHVTAP